MCQALGQVLSKQTEKAHRISLLLFFTLSCDSSTSYFDWEIRFFAADTACCKTANTVQDGLWLPLHQSVHAPSERTVTGKGGSGREPWMTGPVSVKQLKPGPLKLKSWLTVYWTREQLRGSGSWNHKTSYQHNRKGFLAILLSLWSKRHNWLSWFLKNIMFLVHKKLL